jgi:hypothetical protein
VRAGENQTRTGADIGSEVRERGFSIRSGADLQDWLKPSWQDWQGFAASWNDLGEDQYMADGGRYRRRRYAVFEVAKGIIHRALHQPHYQAKVYNRLNGGLERWFEPVSADVGQHPIIQTLIRCLPLVFETAIGPSAGWHVELHQFRIEAHASSQGYPTPEGTHRDGVDGAFVMLINRDNVSSGMTEIFDASHRPLGHFTLSDPGDAVFLDDARVFHGVTPIVPLDPARLATRDVLVITFTRAPASSD